MDGTKGIAVLHNTDLVERYGYLERFPGYPGADEVHSVAVEESVLKLGSDNTRWSDVPYAAGACVLRGNRAVRGFGLFLARGQQDGGEGEG